MERSIIQREKSAPLDIREMFLDVGACSKKEAMESFGINIGDPAAPEVAFEYDEEHGLCFGKAFFFICHKMYRAGGYNAFDQLSGSGAYQ